MQRKILLCGRFGDSNSATFMRVMILMAVKSCGSDRLGFPQNIQAANSSAPLKATYPTIGTEQVRDQASRSRLAFRKRGSNLCWGTDYSKSTIFVVFLSPSRQMLG
jgi:hypothetical protein